MSETGYFAGFYKGGAASQSGIWYNDLAEAKAVRLLVGIMMPAIGEHLAEQAAQVLHDRLAEVNSAALYSLLEGAACLS